MPLVGQIAAGNLSEAIEQADRFDFEDWFPQRKNQFALKVKGDSMIEAQIADGDFVIVEKRSAPEDGETVVVNLDGGKTTIRKYYNTEGGARLRAMRGGEEIFARRPDIRGVVIGVLRKYD